MKTRVIGKNIAELRKAKEITQDKLAKSIGVTAQAVSKWETGGSLDIELLEPIADFFEVSIDKLFGRETHNFTDMGLEMAKDIASTEIDDRFKKAFMYCSRVQAGLAGDRDIEFILKGFSTEESQRMFTQMVLDSGYSIMALDRKLQYYMLMPEPEDGWNSKLGFNPEFQNLFSELGSGNLLESIYFLSGRKNKPFTLKLLEKEFKITGEESESLLKDLMKYDLIITSEIELDDEMQTIYEYNPNPVILGIMALCDTFIERPRSFRLFSQNRKKPIFNSN